MGFQVKMGADMKVAVLEQGVKMFMRAMWKNQDTLVYCDQGLIRSGCFLIFVTSLLHKYWRLVEDIMESYLDDPIFNHRSRACLYSSWLQSGLGEVLDSARDDLEILNLASKIRPKMADIGREPRVHVWGWMQTTIRVPQSKRRPHHGTKRPRASQRARHEQHDKSEQPEG